MSQARKTLEISTYPFIMFGKGSKTFVNGEIPVPLVKGKFPPVLENLQSYCQLGL